MADIRKIIHIDMDAFFASVEQRDHVEYRNKPLIIGGSPEKRGVVSTCSYEARVFGVHSAMPTATAHRLCPQGIFLEGDMAKYKKASEEVFQIFYKYTPFVEPMSIDEAYLDVTNVLKDGQSATELAREILREIYLKTSLTASAGVSYNKFLAKVASSLKKPAGLSVIKPHQAIKFIEDLPIEKFYGIGKVTAKKLKNMNIKYGRDLKALDLNTLLTHFGKVGNFYYQIARGIDNRELEIDSMRKSYGKEVTLDSDTTNLQKIRIIIKRLAIKVSKAVKKEKLAGRTVTLKIKYADFKSVTRSQSFNIGIDSEDLIAESAIALLQKTDAGKKAVRLLGVSISNFTTDTKEVDFEQLLFPFMTETPLIDKNSQLR
ncbi:MAG: DNA polymerase IV [Lentisphaeria bacterium]|nr:DNA polymerase IV [Lentisphaeria bacterium]